MAAKKDILLHKRYRTYGTTGTQPLRNDGHLL